MGGRRSSLLTSEEREQGMEHEAALIRKGLSNSVSMRVNESKQ